MAGPRGDDVGNFCCVIYGCDLMHVVDSLRGLGYSPRGYDLLPGVAHAGSAMSMVKHMGGGEQIHVVLYADGDGYAAAAHCEPDELSRPLQHLAMAAAHRAADYGRGTAYLLADLAQSGLRFRREA